MKNSHKNIKMLSYMAILFVASLSISSTIFASEDAGIRIKYKSIELWITYSVAVDYGKADSCIRDPKKMLYDVLSFLQSNSGSINNVKKDVLMFTLYQSSKKAGNYLSLDRNPFEGNEEFKTIFDGKANKLLSLQIISLLRKELKINQQSRPMNTVRLYKCIDKNKCNDIEFGSFPSDEMKSGFCPTKGNGCDAQEILVNRYDMEKYFTPIHY